MVCALSKALGLGKYALAIILAFSLLAMPFHTLAEEAPPTDTPTPTPDADTGSISGSVIGPDGLTPVADGYVSVRLLEPYNGYYDEVDVSADGSYTISGLPPGNYQVEAGNKAHTCINEFYNNTYYYDLVTPVPVTAAQDAPGIDFVLDTGGSISGHIYETDGYPIAGAEITVNPVENSIAGLRLGYSQDDGSYTVDMLPPGDYRILVKKEGYLDTYYPDSWSLLGAVTVTVAEHENTENMNITLSREGIITGYVYTANDIPVQGASVQAEIPNSFSSSPTITSSADGSYSIPDLIPGNFIVTCKADGYVTQYYKDAVDPDMADEVRVSLAETITGIDFRLSSGGSISGRVLTAEGTTLADTVLVTARKSDSSYQNAYADPEGYYTISGLLPGSYEVTAISSGFLKEYYDNVDKASLAAWVPVLDAQNTPDIDFSLDQDGSISGFVLQSDGVTPVQYAAVKAYTRDGEARGHVSSGADGSYTISGLMSEEYIVYVQATGYTIEYYNGVRQESSATLVSVTAPGETTGINFKLDKSVSISGRVYEADGKTPISGASVILKYLNDNTQKSLKTDSSGSYILKDIKVGRYLVFSYTSTGNSVAVYYGNVFSSAFATLVDVNGLADITGIDIKLDYTSLGSISGRIESSPGKSTDEYWTIDVYDSVTHECVNSSALSSGDYQINDLPAGNYLVRISGDGSQASDRHYYCPQWYPEKYSLNQAVPVTVSPGQDTPNIDFSMAAGTTMSGHVYAVYNSSYLDFRIDIFGYDDNNLYLSMDYSMDSPFGYDYLIGGLPDGRYKVRISAAGFEPQWFNAVSSRQQAEAVTVSGPNSVPGIDFSLTADKTPPAVISTSPAASSTKVKVNSPVKITFSEDVDAEDAFRYFNIYPPAVGPLKVVDNVLTLTPARPLAYTTTYTVTLTLDTRDCAQNTMGSIYTFTFTTEAKRSAGSAGTGSGGGGGVSMPVNHTLTLSGLTSASPLIINGLSYTTSPATLTSTDSKLSLSISQGTSLKNANGSLLSSISAQPTSGLPDPEGQAIILAYNLSPEGALFSPALTLTLSFDGLALPEGISEDDLYLAFWDGSQWAKLQAKLDSAAKTLTAGVSHFSTYALLAVLPPPPETDAAPAPSVPPVSPSPNAPEPSGTVQAANPVTAPGDSASPPASGAVAEVGPAANVTTLPATSNAAASPASSSEAADTGDAPSSLWLIILIAALVLVMLLIFIVLIIRRRRLH